MGRASDKLGRRPFLMGSLALAVMPGLVMLGHVTLGISLLLNYPASILAGGAFHAPLPPLTTQLPTSPRTSSLKPAVR